eukprot:GILI01042426.1.p1 GENE.GILI01042426.1~~GILI01042426.1.p1  ORF type:complete len:136 (+),score=25.26 GILI01042426.1:46-453(+)
MSETVDIVVRRAAIQKEISVARQLLAETLEELRLTNEEMTHTLSSLEEAKRARTAVETRLDELDRDTPVLAANKSASSQRLEDLRHRFGEEVSALSGDNETLRHQTRDFNEAMDDMQNPLVIALMTRFGGKLKKS